MLRVVRRCLGFVPLGVTQGRMKFKERLLLAVVGLFFSVLILLEYDLIKIYANKHVGEGGHSPREIAGGARGLVLEHPVSAGGGDELAGLPRDAKILEEIIEDVGAHLAIIRRTLEQSQKEVSEDQVIRHLLANSSTVHKYSQVFIKVAELLEDRSGSAGGAVEQGGGGPGALRTQEGAEKSAGSGHDAKAQSHRYEDVEDLEPEVEIRYVYRNFPHYRVYAGNTTISNLAHPHGYMKVPGRDFRLGDHVVKKLRDAVDQLATRHVEGRRGRADPLNLYQDDGNLRPHEVFHNHITRYELYPEDAPYLSGVMTQLQRGEIKEVEHRDDQQQQLRFYLTMDGNMRAIFKPIRFLREQETLPDQYYFSDYERHNAEIAAYHLDRLLGFRRAPPVSGRMVDMIDELRAHLPDNLKREFMISPSGNQCFRGKCAYYCSENSWICGQGDTLEGAAIAHFDKHLVRMKSDYPWKRSYSVLEGAKWESDNKFCTKLRQKPEYQTGRRLLDYIDLAVFDFIQGNMDRHTVETFKLYGNDSFILHFDNAKGFGNSVEDELSILAPLRQCCLIRASTLRTLLAYHSGATRLSDALRAALTQDPLTPSAPILLDKHLHAADRRVKRILQTVYDCVYDKRSYEAVVIDDGL